MALKSVAFLLTGSVGLLSDAAESSVNLVAALIAFGALTVAARPADRSHAYGHDKAEYLSSGAEGALILVAAATIIYSAVRRFLDPMPLAGIGPGLLVALAASAINYGVSRIMLSASRKYDSIVLEADAQHLMTDVWTSIGVIIALGVVMLAPPRWAILDPIIAVLVGANIIRTGIGLIRRSLSGIMDSSLPAPEVEKIGEAVRAAAGVGAIFHGLRTRKSGPRRFVELHLLLPGETTIQAGHEVCKRVEAEIQGRLAQTVATIHVEPLGDKDAWDESGNEPRFGAREEGAANGS
jgi:cation diffusion facilitator family transporter